MKLVFSRSERNHRIIAFKTNLNLAVLPFSCQQETFGNFPIFIKIYDMSTKIPEGYQTVTAYLIIPNAAGFIQFTVDVFNAELINKHMREDESLIMHGEIKIGDSVIMFADSTEQYAPRPAGFFIYVENADETYKKALEKGASAVTPVTDQSYGRSGGVQDAFGNTWWITNVI